MRRFLLLLAVMVFWQTNMAAQIVPGIKYSDLKYIYNVKEYKRMQGDPYSPFLAGTGSLFIPGLGQFCCGEKGRGIGMFAAGLAIDGAFYFSASQFVYYINKDSEGNLVFDENGQLFSDEAEAGRWGGYAATFGGIALLYGIYSCVDAVKVAKVRNMYSRDLRNLSTVEFDIYPSLRFVPYQQSVTPAAGMTLAIKF